MNRNTDKIYDLIGIGIGPFNLGMAALAREIPGFQSIFIDRNDTFNWHPGMMLPTARMQVPFYADLVTLANPCSPYTYLNYLKSVGRLFKFAINETYFPYRSEFNSYCKWVASELSNLCFGWTCTGITYDPGTKTYAVLVSNMHGNSTTLHGKHLVVGIGTEASIPDCAQGIEHPALFHSSEYLSRKHTALMNKRITIIGSGQSAAEIFLDLLPHVNQLESLNWFTKSSRFHAMEYSKLTLEMSTPEYIDHFYSLEPMVKKNVLRGQDYLYKGINAGLIDEIYEQLHLMELNGCRNLPGISTNCTLQQLEIVQHHNIQLQFNHTESQQTFEHSSDAVILATGYKAAKPSFLEKLNDVIVYDEHGDVQLRRNYAAHPNNSLFFQNADVHSHGFNSADLGLGPYRNAVMLNTILKKELFDVQGRGNVFQKFGGG